MKRILSLLLALALALSLTVCAAAAPSYQDLADKLSPAGAVTQGLAYELPEVTGLTAVWNGEILVDYAFQPYFSPENVAVTVSFAEGEPETLDKWWDEGNGWFWEVFFDYDRSTGSVTFYYIDTIYWTAYLDSLTDVEEEYDWEVLAATLHKAAITVSDDLVRQYVDGLRPLTALRLDQSTPVVLEEGQSKMFTFTPETDGGYYFYTENVSPDAWITAVIATPAYAPIGGAYFFFGEDLMIGLEAGKTYYIFAAEVFGDACEFELGVAQLRAVSPVMQFIYRYLLFGWLWMPLLTFSDGNGVYMLPGSYIRSFFGMIWDVFRLFLPW